MTAMDQVLALQEMETEYGEYGEQTPHLPPASDMSLAACDSNFSIVVC
ncbi:SapB/AmfS family lanthipeptide [Streptomyces sp. TP-A0874]|nr:SapB/AmfS family lanthipeptide [Streptomyces sp. TP-A0874]